MVTEIFAWVLVVTSNGNATVDVYNNERLCRQDLKEVRRMQPKHKFACLVERHSLRRPGDAGAAEK